MAPVVVFPDATELVCTALRTAFAVRAMTIHVGTVIPQDRPTRMVIARRSGGAHVTPVTDAVDIDLECFADSDAAAHDLAQLARALVHSLEGTVTDGVPVYRVEDTAGPDDEPDPVSDQPRYLLGLSVTVRGRPG